MKIRFHEVAVRHNFFTNILFGVIPSAMFGSILVNAILFRSICLVSFSILLFLFVVAYFINKFATIER
jgi:hypothetical protein